MVGKGNNYRLEYILCPCVGFDIPSLTKILLPHYPSTSLTVKNDVVYNTCGKDRSEKIINLKLRREK